MHFPHPLEIRARRRRVIYLAAALAVLAGLVGWVLLRPGGEPDEPRYEGRTLTWWLGEYTNPFRRVHSVQQLRSFDFESVYRETSRAVKAMGTNAIPVLLRYLQAKDSKYKSGWLMVAGGLRRGNSYTASEKNHMAQAGFMILQKDAAPAVPGLITLTQHKDPDVRFRALQCLLFIIPADYEKLVPVILRFAHDPDPGNRSRAADTMKLILPLLSEEDVKSFAVYSAFPQLRQDEPEKDAKTANAKNK
jgi:hypothetical protein